MDAAETAICWYRVKPGAEEEFLALLRRHWPTLRELEFATPTEPQCYLGKEVGIDGPVIVEIFEWVDRSASRRAAEHPAVAGIWEPMDDLCESREGRPNMEFPHFRPLRLS